MKKNYLNLLLLLLLLSNSVKSQQFKTYDFIKTFSIQTDKPTIIYFCATWCHPCMKKFIPVIDSMQNNKEYNFYVVMEQGNYEKIIPILAKHTYNDTVIKLVSGKYYSNNSKRLIQIKINSQAKVFKNLANEIDSVYRIGIEKEKIWVGGAIIYNKEKIFLTGFDHDADELIKIIKDKLKEFAPKTEMQATIL